MRRRLLFFTTCILFLSLSGCLSEEFLPTDKQLPKDGTWYCETLEMQLVFGESGESESESWVVLNGEKILCNWANDRGSPVIWIFPTETTQYAKTEHPLLSLEIVTISENTIIVTDRDTNVSHTFVSRGDGVKPLQK